MKYILIFVLILASMPFSAKSAINFKVDNNSIQVSWSFSSDELSVKDKKFLFDSELISRNAYGADKISFKIAAMDSDIKSSMVQVYSKTGGISRAFPSELELHPLGLRRGVPLHEFAFNPFSTDLLSNSINVADSGVIKITFSRYIPMYLRKDISREFHTFYSDVLNFEQLPNFLSVGNKSKTKVLTSDSWFDFSKPYLKISTISDGVARINFSDIISKMPNWNGLPANGFHLINRGKDFPIYIDAQQGNVGPNSTIYFLGRTAVGDTLRFDTYTSNEVFYLTYDESKAPVRLTLLDNQTGGEEITKVDINYHIERDSTYFHGTNTIFPATARHEGWYWAKLFRIRYGWEALLYQLQTNLNFLPAEDEELEIKMKYVTLNYGGLDEAKGKEGVIDPKHRYRFNLLLNNDTVATKELNEWSEDFVSFKRLGNTFHSGTNNFRVISWQADTNNGLLGIDYFKINGKAKPFIDNGKVQFDINSLPQFSNLKLRGFRNSDIVAIDSVSKSIAFLESSQGYRFVASASSGVDSSLVVAVNDSLIRVNGRNYILAYASPSNKPIIRIGNSLNEAGLIEEINKIATNSIIVFATNRPEQMPQGLASALQGIGSAQVANFVAGNSFVLSVVKGRSNVSERLTDGSMCSIDGFFEQNEGGSFEADISFNPNQKYSIFASDNSSIELTQPEIVVPKKILVADSSAEMIIVTHPKFRAEADKYANYKNSTGVKCVVTETEDIYREFSFGMKSPHAIKAYLKFAYANWSNPKPKYLLIIGDASWDNRKVLKGTKGEDYVPSYGQPVSDYWYGLLEGDDWEHELIVGRISAQETDQVDAYLEKVKTYENQPALPWNRRILYLSGGTSLAEIEEFYQHRYYVFDQVMDSPFCADTITIQKRSQGVGAEDEKPEIINNINQGACWTTYLGHASSQLFDMDGWYVENLNNKNKTGFLSTLSCNTGAFAEPFDLHGRNEKYTLTRDKGFVVAFGSTGAGIVYPDLAVISWMHEALGNPQKSLRRAGDILYYGKSKLTVEHDYYFVTRQIFQLLGDPTVKIKVGTDPDMYFVKDEIDFSSSSGTKNLKDKDDSLHIWGTLFNHGYYFEKPFSLRVVHSYKNTSDTIYLDYNSICFREFFDFSLGIKGKAGEHKVEISAFSYEFEDADLSNNSIILSYYVYSDNILLVDPLEHWNVSPSRPTFRFINPLSNEAEFEYQFEIKEINSNLDTIQIAKSKSNEIFDSKYKLDWRPDISLNSGQYILIAKSYNKTTNTESSDLVVNFSVISDFIADSLVEIELNKKNELETFTLENMTAVQKNGKNALIIEEKRIPFTVLARNGNYFEEKIPWCKIIVGNAIYADMQYSRGLNVVVIPKTGLNPKGRYVRFDTWQDSLSSENFVRLLRDTVSDGDYILIATNDQSFRVPVDFYPPTHIGSIDSLRAVLRLYGANLVDSLDYYASYAFVGFKGARHDQVFEMYNHTDTALVEGDLTFYTLEGKARSHTYGPAKKWISFAHEENADEGILVGKKLVFTNSTGSSEKVVEFNSNSLIALDSISAEQYPFVRFDLEAYKQKIDDKFSISDITFQFEPSPEIVALGISEPINSVLRGDTFTDNYSFENISLRSNSDNATIESKITDASSVVDKTTSAMGLVNRNTSKIFTQDIITDTYDFAVTNLVTALPDYTELYRFNNSSNENLSIIEDTTNPTILVRVNGEIVKDGDFISKLPFISITLEDDSRLPISDETSISVRLNGSYQSAQNTISYRFESFGRDIPLKAILEFAPDTLKETSNSLFIYFKDASGNRDTIKYVLNISKNGKLDDLLVYPNPSIDKVNLSFYMKSPENFGKAKVTIYNSAGRLVAQISDDVKIGNNKLTWNLLDDDGNRVAPGLYLFLVQIEDSVYFDPIYGKVLVSD